jgi:hypothetical protein
MQTVKLLAEALPLPPSPPARLPPEDALVQDEPDPRLKPERAERRVWEHGLGMGNVSELWHLAQSLGIIQRQCPRKVSGHELPDVEAESFPVTSECRKSLEC